MAITHLLAVVPVTDVLRAADWYALLLGRPADARPMPSLADFHLGADRWVQVFEDPERAGSTLLNLGVDDIAAELGRLRAAGLEPGEVVAAASPLCSLHDPDGNRVTLIEGPVGS